ncbi:MAG TPA: exo-alpha-sialidase [Candidatus Hydrogenedentes bacterium]|nr:exo-alpha-sialidase [Candidatus Hydrogenedentota bacterium]
MLLPEQERTLTELLAALIDQEAAKVLVPPYANAAGYWFGGGNVARDDHGRLWLVGRYRNEGDARSGVAKGVRGLELGLFISEDGGERFTKIRSWSKADLSMAERPVLSIEGAALHPCDTGWELFVSTEKAVAYPDEVGPFQKPGTGVWSMDVFTGPSPDRLDERTLDPVFTATPDPRYLHVKDPVVFDRADGATVLVFCSHPFCWTSVNSGYAVRPAGARSFAVLDWEMVGRGPTWDVAGTRVTCRMSVPRLGVFAAAPPMSVYFYDGLECVRALDQNPHGVQRPRGYSCEELGGAGYGLDAEFPRIERLSKLRPLFVSPHGTGCSRYVSVLVDDAGMLATWQQGQEDGSQPLVGLRLTTEEIGRIINTG